MSLYRTYSGQQQESKYLSYIKTLIHVLEKRLLRFYQNRACNEPKFFSLLHKLVQKINKYEIHVNHEITFHDSVSTLLEQISPYDQDQFKRMNTGSQISFGFDDNISSLEHENNSRHLPVAKFKSKTEQGELYDSYRKHKYHSHETIKPVITPIHEMADTVGMLSKRSRSIKSRHQTFKRIQSKLRPPKITPYINTIREQIKNQERETKRGYKKITEESFLGQRRTKMKRHARPGIFY